MPTYDFRKKASDDRPSMHFRMISSSISSRPCEALIRAYFSELEEEADADGDVYLSPAWKHKLRFVKGPAIERLLTQVYVQKYLNELRTDRGVTKEQALEVLDAPADIVDCEDLPSELVEHIATAMAINDARDANALYTRARRGI